MTNHTNCLHPATPAGRAACRKAGSPQAFHNQLAQKAKDSAPCESCFNLALESAAMNIDEDRPHTWNEDFEADSIRHAEEHIHAREYLFDRSGLTACSDHEDKLS